jgi:hypothetical protein
LYFENEKSKNLKKSLKWHPQQKQSKKNLEVLQVCCKKMSKRSSNLMSSYISSLMPSFKFSSPIKGALWIIENKG